VLGARAWIVKMFKKDMELQRKLGAPNAIGNFHESIFKFCAVLFEMNNILEV
jgi:hypothetical protein